MVLIPIPFVELSAHYIGYMVRIIEFKPRRRGNFAKCVGSLSLIGFPLCAWASAGAEWQWAIPAALYFTLVGVCGYILEEIEEQECVLEVEAANEDDWREPNILYIEEARGAEQVWQ